MGRQVYQELKEPTGVKEPTEHPEQTLILQSQGVLETQGTTHQDAVNVTLTPINEWSTFTGNLFFYLLNLFFSF